MGIYRYYTALPHLKLGLRVGIQMVYWSVRILDRTLSDRRKNLVVEQASVELIYPTHPANTNTNAGSEIPTIELDGTTEQDIKSTH